MNYGLLDGWGCTLFHQSVSWIDAVSAWDSLIPLLYTFFSPPKYPRLLPSQTGSGLGVQGVQEKPLAIQPGYLPGDSGCSQ